MTVKDAIKGLDHFVITRDGKFLGICNGKVGLICDVRDNLRDAKIKMMLMDEEVKKIQISKGFVDYTCIRL